MLASLRKPGEGDRLHGHNFEHQLRLRPARRRQEHLLGLLHIPAPAVQVEQSIVELRREVVCLEVERAELRARRPARQRIVVVALGAHPARIDAHDAEARAPLLLMCPLALDVEIIQACRFQLFEPLWPGLNSRRRESRVRRKSPAGYLTSSSCIQ
eukprot:5055863-Pleurochrysis_carterae.AAC.3